MVPPHKCGDCGIKFFLDHNVPAALWVFLNQNGLDAVRLQDVMAADSKDPIVATAAMEASRILVSWDKDFKQQRFNKARFASLSVIGMSGEEMYAVERFSANLDRIKFELRRAKGNAIRLKIGTDRYMAWDQT